MNTQIRLDLCEDISERWWYSGIWTDGKTQTLRLTGLKTKREAVELGLRTVVRLRQQEGLRRLRGRLNWQGDLDHLRRDR